MSKSKCISFASQSPASQEWGSKCHVSWLPSTLDSVSDVVLITHKLKREIYKTVTQSLWENHHKRLSGSGCSGKEVPGTTGQLVPELAPLGIAAGATEGSRDTELVCTPAPCKGTGRNWGCNSEPGQFLMRQCCQAGRMGEPSWAAVWLADGWAGAWEHSVSETNATRHTRMYKQEYRFSLQGVGRSPFPLPCRGRAAAGVQAVSFGVWHHEKEHTPVRHSVRGSHGANRGRDNISDEEKPNALQLFCLKKERRVFQHVRLQSRKELLSACGAARKFLLSHWETFIAGKGSKGGDRWQQWRWWSLHHCTSLKTNNLLEQCGCSLCVIIIIYIILEVVVLYGMYNTPNQ